MADHIGNDDWTLTSQDLNDWMQHRQISNQP